MSPLDPAVSVSVRGCLLPALHFTAAVDHVPAHFGARLAFKPGEPLYAVHVDGDRTVPDLATLVRAADAFPVGVLPRSSPPLPAVRIEMADGTSYEQTRRAVAAAITPDNLRRAHVFDLWEYASDGRFAAAYWTVEVTRSRFVRHTPQLPRRGAHY